MDTAQIKAAANILDLAGHYTALKKWSSAELAGPCPHCGGMDRFHVHRDGWWKCYQCHAKPADVIELVMWAERCDFKTACARLDKLAGSPSGSPRPLAAPSDPHCTPAWRAEAWQRAAQHVIAMSTQTLAAPTANGDAARAYLYGRGLEPETLQAWSIGCARQLHPTLRTQEHCIVIPWQHSPPGLAVRAGCKGARGTVKAVQYRYFGERIGKRERFSARPGSERTLFGVDLLTAASTLLLVEGELNALSVWQIARAVLVEGKVPVGGAAGLDLDVCSVGAEANVCHPAAVKLAARYRHVVVWTDEPARARQAQATIPHAVALTSPDAMDANDLLQHGALAQFLPAALEAVLPLAGTGPAQSSQRAHVAVNSDVDPTDDPRPDLGDSATWRRLLATAYQRDGQRAPDGKPGDPAGLYAALWAARCDGSYVTAGALVTTLDTVDLVYPHGPAIEAIIQTITP